MFATAVVLAVGVGLLYLGRGYLAWTVAAALALVFWATDSGASLALTLAALGFAGAAFVFGRPELRRQWVTTRVLPMVGRLLPRLGETERIALEAGTVWWDGDLFSGRPDWRKLLDFEVGPLSPSEQAFLDGPVEQLCAMLDDWDIQQRGDLPEEVWRFLREQRFFGMIIPTAQGGLGFSAAAHSAVVTKIASRSIAAAVTVMVPN
jgi:acyl-CoA dehydrogenase